MLDIRPVAYIVGWLVAVLGLLMLFPFALDFVDGNSNAGAFALSSVLTLLTGVAVVLACAQQSTLSLSRKQGFAFTTASWVFLPAVSTLPFMLGEPYLSFTDAYFEAMSGMTTTGSTVIVGLDQMSRGILLWRGLLQWSGGVGVVLMAMILLPVLNIGGMQILKIGDFNTIDKIMPRASAIAAAIGSVYLVLTLGCTLGYVWGGMSEFDAIVHAMCTIATGGLANYDASFTNFSSTAQYVAIVFMLISSLSFVRFVQLARGNPEALLGDTQIRAFLVIYTGFVLAMVGARLLQGDPLTERTMREVMFNVASILSSTGFSNADYSQWGGLAAVLFLCIMFIGGCSGSTAGGPKVFRYQLLLSAISAEVRRLYSPSVVYTPRYQGRPVSDALLGSVSAFFMLYFLTFGTISVLLVLAGVEPIVAISGTASSMGNVGPGLGAQIGPAGSYADVSAIGKWMFSLAMMLGRLELMSVFVLFTPVYWRA